MTQQSILAFPTSPAIQRRSSSVCSIVCLLAAGMWPLKPISSLIVTWGTIGIMAPIDDYWGHWLVRVVTYQLLVNKQWSNYWSMCTGWLGNWRGKYTMSCFFMTLAGFFCFFKGLKTPLPPYWYLMYACSIHSRCRTVSYSWHLPSSSGTRDNCDPGCLTT